MDKLFIKKIEEILKANLKLKTNKEYFRIDTIGWSGYKKWKEEAKHGHEKHKGFQKCGNGIASELLDEYNWNLEVAVEYENDPHKWMDEVIKLCHIKCGLKVPIVYSNKYDRKDKGKLALAAKNMMSLTYAKPTDKDNIFSQSPKAKQNLYYNHPSYHSLQRIQGG